MKKIVVAIIALTLSANALVLAIEPIERNFGKLHLSIDPRMELLSTIQILSNYNVIDKKSVYSKEILSFFSSSSSQKAVALTDQLLNNHGFSYDAPVAFMLYLSPVPVLKQRIQYSDYLVKRAGGKENLDNYSASMAQFAKASDFKLFWKNQKSFYNKVLNNTINDMGSEDLIKILEKYFNQSQNSYSIIISPSFKGGYGPMIPARHGKYDVYACITAGNMIEDIPFVNFDNLTYYMWHEFAHSFINPLTEKHAAKVDSLVRLFEPIKEDMSKLAYKDLHTCVNELIIRAINVRLQELNNSSMASKVLLKRELSNRFIYMQPVLNKLKEFERLRNTKHITFSDFYPQILNMLDSLQRGDYLKFAEKRFEGPINLVTMNQKVAWIYPTNDTDVISLRLVQDYVSKAFNRFKSEGSILISDSAALTCSLSDYGIMAYGTIESNLFLSHYKSTFPFKIDNNTIYANKAYQDVNTRFITCLPNPQNPLKGMAIHTAISNYNIPDINNVYHGGEDYLLFISRKKILSKGYYDKTKGWSFTK